MKRVVAGALIVAGFASPAAAQASLVQAGDSARRPSAAACDSIVRRATVDSIPAVVTAYLVRTDGGVMSRAFAELTLQEFGQRFRVPQPLRIQLLAPGPASLRALAPERRDSTAPRELRLQGVYDFTAVGDGGASGIRVRLTSLASGFDSAVVATLEAMSREHSIPLAAGGDSPDSIPLRLSITSGPAEAGWARALFRTMMPRIGVSDAEEGAANPAPAYPDVERALGMDGYVLLQLVVSDEGRVEPGTVEILQATSGPFMRAAIAMLDSLRFTPARVGACPVPQVYQLPLRFVAKPTAAAKAPPTR